MTFVPKTGKLAKSHELIETIGVIDELNSFIGLLISKTDEKIVSENLTDIQKKIFMLGAYLTSNNAQTLNKSDFKKLEEQIDSMSAGLALLNNFILPGGSETAAIAHLCRSLSRKAERRLVKFNQTNSISPDILAWINRLSDYFFTLARFLNQKSSAKETTWNEQ